MSAPEFSKAENASESRKVEVERDKAILEFMKHMASITSGALVFVAGFAEKFVHDGDQRFFTTAIFAFLLSLLFNLAAYSVSLFWFFGRPGPKNMKVGELFAFLATLTAVAMLIGFGAIAVGATSIAHAKPVAMVDAL